MERLFFSLPCALLLSPWALARPAHAFTEDVCFSSGEVQGCYAMGDCAQGDASATCKAAALAGAAGLGNGRSLVHFDATYLLARVVGLDLHTAWLVAAYDQAADLGQTTPVDADGQPLVDPSACKRLRADPAPCEATTGVIDGLGRTSLSTGGYQLHVSMPFNPDGPVPVAGLDGRAPDVTDEEHEVVLANLAAWVYEDAPLCVGGLYDFAGGACLGASTVAPSRFYAELPLLGLTDGVPLEIQMGVQQVATRPSANAEQLLRAVPAAHVEAAKLGVYLHLLQDRVSHHVCGDASVMYALPGPGDDVVADYDRDACDAVTHALRHTWETGYPLDGVYESTRAALEVSYDALLTYALATGVAAEEASQDAVRDAWIDAILDNLEIADGAERWAAMHDQREDAGYGYPSATYGY